MADHPCDGAFGCSGGTERIAVEFASDNDLMAACADGALQGFDRRGTDARFDKDRFDFSLGNEIGKIGHRFSSGFGGGVDSLDGMDLQTKRASEVGEGIVGGDEDALIGGDAADLFAQIFGQGGEFFRVIKGTVSKDSGVKSIVSANPFREGFCYLSPELWAVPDVGVKFALFGLQKLARWNRGSDLKAFMGEVLEDGRHASLEVESIVEDQVRIVDAGDIACGGSVEVGIDAWAHERDDFNLLSADAPGKIGDHAGGGDDSVFLWTLKRARQAPAEQEPDQYQSEGAELTQSYPRLQKLAKANFRR